MFKRLALVATISTLAGCVTTEERNLHHETIAAIHGTENNINQRLTNLELQSSNQVDYIDSLENEVSSLKQQIHRLNQNHYQHSLLQESNSAQSLQHLASSDPAPANKVILGQVERISIESIKQKFDARVDTGAATSSLDATDIEEFERNGKNWVRFHLSGRGEQDDAQVADKKNASDKTAKPEDKDNWIEAPVVRYVKIRQASTSESERRAVVELWISVGNIRERTEFTLADRSHMSHPILLGREFLRDIALVDVSKKYIQSTAK
ncbi:ATP-dependent zinc protease family protein [Vibrio rhizosphaerae]|uniref:ATP-dependent zinc protease n=1 Tax=Vibrio rhizosphaerae TaxID=398736 RepID=A0ABU4IUZ3_9VIBR|nr:ATP-dependent zinc protease [Vibrio rhizosphaerae]MDW6093175.1 ATP-dependent zinc protease [Vibrio rhizosphaerae]